MKEKLHSLLGGFGVILYYGLTLLIAVLPLVMIDVPFWADFLILIVVNVFPPLSLPLWIWGLIAAIKGSQDIFAIIYYILFAIFVLYCLINLLLSLLTVRAEKKSIFERTGFDRWLISRK